MHIDLLSSTSRLGQRRMPARRPSRSAAVYARFVQPDPIGLQGGLNLYRYAKADPVNFVDPDGLKPADVCTGTRLCSMRDGSGRPNPYGMGQSGFSTGGAYACVAYCGDSQVMADGTIVVTASQWAWVSTGVGSGWIFGSGFWGGVPYRMPELKSDEAEKAPPCAPATMGDVIKQRGSQAVTVGGALSMGGLAASAFPPLAPIGIPVAAGGRILSAVGLGAQGLGAAMNYAQTGNAGELAQDVASILAGALSARGAAHDYIRGQTLDAAVSYSQALTSGRCQP